MRVSLEFFDELTVPGKRYSNEKDVGGSSGLCVLRPDLQSRYAMDFDVENLLGAVERSLSLGERNGLPVRAVTISRAFETPADNLWDAVTSPERIPRWFLPISGELEPGGRYQLEGNAGGLITECKAQSRFSLTWEFAGDTSWVDVHLALNESGHIRLTLTHTTLLSEHWHKYGPGAVGVGWELALLGLGIHLGDPNQSMPVEGEFAASTDGRAIIAGSSESWGQAAVAAGEDPEQARQAALRTTAFYTGETV